MSVVQSLQSIVARIPRMSLPLPAMPPAVARYGLPVAAGAAVLLAAYVALGRRAKPPECSMKFYPAAHHGGVRKASALTLIVLHSTEGPSAESAAGWFQSPDAKGSAHVVVGEGTGNGVCYRCLDDLVEPWGAAGANHNGLHLEITGYAKWTRAEWLQRKATLALARAQVRAWASQYGIPLRFVDAAGLKRGDRGVTTHHEVTKAFHGGVGHWDPGSGFPRDQVAVVGAMARPTGLIEALGVAKAA